MTEPLPHPLLYMGSVEPASERMAAYVGAWTPPRTPQGRPLHRIRRLQGPFLEEVISIIAEGQLAHITIQGLTDIYHHQDLRMIPITGMSPMFIAPVWHSREQTASTGARPADQPQQKWAPSCCR